MPARSKSRFRPCIDLHHGKVKQIVGSTIDQSDFQENFVSEKSSAWYAEKFRNDNLVGGHVIRLGDGNDEAATAALEAWPNGLQLGGGITIDNANVWIDAGASHVIVTSWLFEGAAIGLGSSSLVGQRHWVKPHCDRFKLPTVRRRLAGGNESLANAD